MNNENNNGMNSFRLVRNKSGKTGVEFEINDMKKFQEGMELHEKIKAKAGEWEREKNPVKKAFLAIELDRLRIKNMEKSYQNRNNPEYKKEILENKISVGIEPQSEGEILEANKKLLKNNDELLKAILKDIENARARIRNNIKFLEKKGKGYKFTE